MIKNYHIITTTELLILVLAFLLAPRFFKKAAILLFLEKTFCFGWFVLSLSVVYQLFYVATIGVYFFILYSLKHELLESIYYVPEKNKLSIELKSLRLKLNIDKEEKLFGHVVSISENYIVLHLSNFTFTPGQIFSARTNIGGDELDLEGQVSWVKGSYYCVEVDESLKNNHWSILYGKIQSLGVF